MPLARRFHERGFRPDRRHRELGLVLHGLISKPQRVGCLYVARRSAAGTMAECLPSLIATEPSAVLIPLVRWTSAPRVDQSNRWATGTEITEGIIRVARSQMMHRPRGAGSAVTEVRWGKQKPMPRSSAPAINFFITFGLSYPDFCPSVIFPIQNFGAGVRLHDRRRRVEIREERLEFRLIFRTVVRSPRLANSRASLGWPVSKAKLASSHRPFGRLLRIRCRIRKIAGDRQDRLRRKIGPGHGNDSVRGCRVEAIAGRFDDPARKSHVAPADDALRVTAARGDIANQAAFKSTSRCARFLMTSRARTRSGLVRSARLITAAASSKRYSASICT